MRAPIFVVLLIVSWPTRTWAQPAPPQVIQGGKPARPLALAIRPEEPSRLHVGHRSYDLGRVVDSELQIEPVQVAADARINVIRAGSAGARLVAVLGGNRGDELLFLGREDFHGDPGERTRSVVRVSQEAPGQANLSVATVHERVTLCRDRPAWFGVQQVARDSLRLQPSSESPQQNVAVELAAAPAVALLPVLTPLDATSSSNPGGGHGPLMPVPPRALSDRDPTTTWSFEQGAQSFAVFRLERAFPVEQLVFSLTDQHAPRSLLLMGDDETIFRMRVPPGTKGRVAVDLPHPAAWTCLAIVPEVANGDAPPVLAELEVRSEIERSGGLAWLVSLVAQGDARTDAALNVLRDAGEPGALALVSRLSELGERGIRRALRVLVGHTANQVVAQRLLEAARHDPELGLRLVERLDMKVPSGPPLLRELAANASPAGDAAARKLARKPGEGAFLLAALSVQGGTERPALRSALREQARIDSRQFMTLLSAFHGSPSSAAALGLALADNDTYGPAVLALLSGLFEVHELDFATRYRMALALRSAPAADGADQWLARQARSAPEWMMRQAALSVLRARSPRIAREIAQQSARDEAPRVRVEALASLDVERSAASIEQAATADRWPMVRAAAVNRLAPRSRSRPVLAHALNDPSRLVRSAAIEGLQQSGARETWPQVKHRLEAPDEWPSVRASAIRFTAALCITDARESLTFLARSALSPKASESTAELGKEALAALHALGGQAAKDARTLAQRDGAASLMAWLDQLPAASCTSPETIK